MLEQTGEMRLPIENQDVVRLFLNGNDYGGRIKEG